MGTGRPAGLAGLGAGRVRTATFGTGRVRTAGLPTGRGAGRAAALGGGNRRPSGTSAPLGRPRSVLSLRRTGRDPFFVRVGGPCDLTATTENRRII